MTKMLLLISILGVLLVSCKKDEDLIKVFHIGISSTKGLTISAQGAEDIVIYQKEVKVYTHKNIEITLTNNDNSGENISVTFKGQTYLLKSRENVKIKLE